MILENLDFHTYLCVFMQVKRLLSICKIYVSMCLKIKNYEFTKELDTLLFF